MYEGLKSLKELLDIGAITQEEFDAKKREVLGIESDEDRIKREQAEAKRKAEDAARKEAQAARTKRMIKVAIPALVIVIALAGVAAYASGAEARESRANMEPYLALLGLDADWGPEIDVSDALVSGADEIEVMGVKGTVSCYAEDGEIVIVKWRSNDAFTDDERDDYIESLNDYFGSEYIFEFDQLGDREWYIYDHIWQDETVPCEASVSYDYLPNVDDLEADDKVVTIEWDASDGWVFDSEEVELV